MPEPDTFVLIPTANRPEFLAAALDSVAGQTGRDRIREVRVMENGGDRRSEAVSAQFADRLPIRYVFRQPSLTPLEHGRLITGESYPCRYVAILHDDDWWAPRHLSCSFEALERNKAVACYSASYDVQAGRPAALYDGSLMCAFACGYPPITRNWSMDLASVLVANFPGTPGRFSTLVADAGVFRECACVLDSGNDFDNDRMYSVALGTKGKMVYRPLPSVFIRAHPGQDGHRHTGNEQFDHALQTTVWLFAVAKENRIDLMKELEARLNACPRQFLEAILKRLTIPVLYQLLRTMPDLPPLLLEYWRQIERRDADSGRGQSPAPASLSAPASA